MIEHLTDRVYHVRLLRTCTGTTIDVESVGTSPAQAMRRALADRPGFAIAWRQLHAPILPPCWRMENILKRLAR